MKRTVLVVDDDPGILEVIKIILEDNGYQVITLSNAYQVLKQVSECAPHLIVMDLWMSGIDGHQLSKKLKNNHLTKHIPIVVISALSNIEEITKQSQADDFLAKPFNINDLVMIVKKWIKN